ncbi:glycosyltransferase [Vreelandella titanicae]|uniref:glycosyltransferase n=1 Tax=Vreelandella titanicae TaxID=664683 RepID=UPI0011415C1B|nr:glycosyltransferase [Halomonas titanicae]
MSANEKTMKSLEKGNYLFKKGRYQDAIDVYEQALDHFPELKSFVIFNMEMAKRKISESFSQADQFVKDPLADKVKFLPAIYALNENAEYYDKDHPAAAYLLNCQLYTVDIIIPVYNALEDVKNCLRSIEINTDKFRIKAIVVNDKSDEATTKWLRDFCASKQLFSLIEQPENRGYTKAINTGLSFSQADYVVTLNSDTIVTKGWLEGLVRCIRSDSKLGIVGPLSNAASWQNVPNLLDKNKQFAVNDIPLSMTPDEMAELVFDASQHIYPRVPFVNGFCFMMSRELIDVVGVLDEAAFPTGYGEENDYCIRAANAGFELAIADDTYVFHAKSKSFGHGKRKELSRQGSKKLKEKHTVERVESLINIIKDTKQLNYVRNNISIKLKSKEVNVKNEITEGKEPLKISDISILFILPVLGSGGGIHSIVQEAYAMQRIGVNVKIAMWNEQISSYCENYSDLSNPENLFVGFTEGNLNNLAEKYDVVIATLFTSVKYLKKIIDTNPHILPAYYIQDYEPLFFKKNSTHWKEAYNSYNMIPDMFSFAKTHWIIDKVKDGHGLNVEKVSPSIDHNVYKVDYKNRLDDKVVISAMIRPQTPRRGAARTMRILSQIYKANQPNVEIKIFGCESNDTDFNALELDFEFFNHGVLKRLQVAEVLSSSDIFIDLSDYQAFGRTGLEAMACGAVAVLPKFGGAHEYAIHHKNALLLDSFDEEYSFHEIQLLINSKRKLWEMKNQALLTAAEYSVHKAAVTELIPMLNRLTELRKCHPKVNKQKLVIFPSLQKDRLTPTGSAYVRLLLPYQVPKVLKWNSVEVVQAFPDPNLYDKCTLIMQRNVPEASLYDIQSWVNEWKGKGHKLVYDLDDDLLNMEGFKSKGSFDTSSPDKVIFLAKSADLVTVSTNELKEKLYSFAKRIVVVKNSIDEKLWELKNERNHTLGDYKRFVGRPITIGYIGTPSHIDDVKIIESAIAKIKQKYGDKVKVEVIGVFENEEASFGERVGLPKKRDYPNFVDWLQRRVHWDIGVIPLEKNEFNKSKSFLKFLEYAALDMAIVVSDHPVYSEVAKDNENCLIASSSIDSWVEKISKLVEDCSLREKIAKKAFQECRECYVLNENYDLTSQVLDQIQ